jgi:hypothetical protein
MLYISAYPLLALGLVSLVPRWGRRHGDLFVSLAITATVGLLCWSFLIVPAGGTRGVTFATRLVAIGYPLMDTCLLAVLMTAMVSQGRRNPSTRCLGIGLLLLLIADVGYACQNFGTAYALGAAPDAAWLLSYAAFGAALLHPSLRDEPVQPPAPAAVSTTSPAADRRSTTVVLVRPALGTLHIETVAFLSGWFLLALATMTVALSAMWLTSDLVLVAGAYGVTGLVMVCAGSKYHHAR